MIKTSEPLRCGH